MLMTKGLFTAVIDNITFVLICMLLTAVMVAAAWYIEKIAKKKSGSTERTLTTRKVVMIGMFSAIAAVLQIVDFALPIAPSFYKFDFSEIPALIGGFAFGPVAGVLIEFVKIILKLLIKSTSTAFVGELANFIVGCMMILPASALYIFHKTRGRAAAGCIAGTVCMTVFGTVFNALYLLPAFSRLYGMPLEAIIGMGTAINASVTNIWNFVLLMVAPFNILKGASVSIITMLVYKKISPLIKRGI